MLCKFKRPKAKSLSENGFRVAVFNPRGFRIPQISSNLIDFSKVHNDFDFVVKHIEKKYPENSKYMVGFSLGASYGMQYLSRYKEKSSIKGMVSVGNPFNVYEAFLFLDKPFNRIYGHFITNKLKKIVNFNKDAINANVSQKNIDFKFKDLDSINNIFDFNKLFTFKFLNQTDSQVYLNSLSCFEEISNVDIPTLIINSKNDPIAK